MPSSRVVSREQALRNKSERTLKAAEEGRKTLRGRQAAMSETVDFFVGGAARGIGKAGQAYANQLKKRPEIRAAELSGKLAAQFASKAAETVIRDAQGAAKMIMKGFGN